MAKRTFAKRSSMPKTEMPSVIVGQRSFQSTLHRSQLPTADQPDLHTQLAIAQRTRPDWSQMTIGGTASVQAKLKVGAPGDQYEQEADRVAEQVMSMPDSAIQQPVQREVAPEEDEVQTKPIATSITPLVQREAMPEEEEVQTKAIDIQREEMPEDEEVQTKPLGTIQRSDNLEEEEIQTKPVAGTVQREEIPEDEGALQTKALGNGWLQREEMPEEEEVQTKPLANTLQRQEMPEDEEAVQTKPSLQQATDGGLQTDGNLESRLNSSKGGGSPLPQDVKGFMESRFRTDFSQVRVHTDSEAVQMNRDLNAQAFTHKQDVYFGAGKAPGKDALTAHELTHVVQQLPIDKTAISRLPDIQLDETPLQKVTRLDQEIAQGMKNGDWEMAAKALNQYNVEDIQKTLKNFQGKRITSSQKRGIHQGAISSGLGPHSNAAKETSLVPGLPKERVADVESKWISNDRSATVREAALVLSEVGKMDLTKMGGDRNNIRGIAYDENASSDTTTVKSYGVTAGYKPPIVNIYPIAFEKDLSWLFATILHEYQHVLQYTDSPEAVIRGAEKEKSNQQEVEAWASMLINAKETGIIASPDNVRECWQGLESYWDSLGPETKEPLEKLYKKAKSVARKVLGSSEVK